ncbi:unnamed protein product [Protopolystoma xenopodis]|uniref:Uncharacterized protein n=1 Tax=Protopolystoma xenopodis TaxID=117903 RepID=A0A448XJS0_9PLAT|nr:unnamed protein product [Protopolystoma xenopodis]
MSILQSFCGPTNAPSNGRKYFMPKPSSEKIRIFIGCRVQGQTCSSLTGWVTKSTKRRLKRRCRNASYLVKQILHKAAPTDKPTNQALYFLLLRLIMPSERPGQKKAVMVVQVKGESATEREIPQGRLLNRPSIRAAQEDDRKEMFCITSLYRSRMNRREREQKLHSIAPCQASRNVVAMTTWRHGIMNYTPDPSLKSGVGLSSL